MKAAILLALMVVGASAIPRFSNSPSISSGISNTGGRQQQQPLRPTNPKANFGPRFYGQGLENPYAWPVNPFHANSIRRIVEATPGALARVDLDGEITITNQFGQEVDIVDRFGREFFDF